MNRLAKERSAYLQHTALQKIDWYPWSEEAFERAAREDKPVFLSSGAIWCHWCHVMAKESFGDEEVVRLLNQHFIAVKLDRDERPDIDRRYQQALAVMGFGGGWPLSMFLTPDKKPFYGGTYFPPDEAFGRPGFKAILSAIAEFYKEKKEEIREHGQQFLEHIKQQGLVPGDIGIPMTDEAKGNMMSTFDSVHGGFGTAPKFPMSGALEFLLGRYFFSGDGELKKDILKTLLSMARGGIHDQLGGGFHRYSTDAAWIILHFEKMADDNAWLLRNYIHAYSLFGDSYLKEVAEGIITFLLNELSDPDGGFYASQDADVTPDDEGGYFLWTDADFRKTLDEDEYRVLSSYLLHDKGAMRHNPEKKVLHVLEGIDEMARKTGMDTDTLNNIIDTGKTKLLMERAKREKPFLDKALYTSLNGMLIAAFFEAYKALKDDDIKGFALKSLDKVLAVNFAGGQLFHAPGVKALLDDYVNLAGALIGAYEVTGRATYLEQAEACMKTCMENFWDGEDGGFFDTDEEVIGIRLKGAEDIPHPSANAVGIINLIKLSSILGKEEYLDYAEKGLRCFSSTAKVIGVHGGYYFCALDAYFHTVKLDTHAAPGSPLAEAALTQFYPYKAIVYGKDEGFVIPCVKDTCYEPQEDPDKLKSFLNGLSGKQ